MGVSKILNPASKEGSFLAAVHQGGLKVRIEKRPEEAHEILTFIRARGWRYDPRSTLPWQRGPLSIKTADEALSLELGEMRMALER